MIIVLALDVAKNRTGWAVNSPDWKRPHWGVFEVLKWEGNQDVELNRFNDWLSKLHSEHKFNYIATEKTFVNVKIFDYFATEAQMMLCGQAWSFAAAHGLRCAPIDIDFWRKRFLGANRRPKDSGKDDKFWKKLAVNVCAQKHNWFTTFHDEAEALGICDYALSELSPEYRARTTGVNNRTQQDADLRRGAHEG